MTPHSRLVSNGITLKRVHNIAGIEVKQCKVEARFAAKSVCVCVSRMKKATTATSCRSVEDIGTISSHRSETKRIKWTLNNGIVDCSVCSMHANLQYMSAHNRQKRVSCNTRHRRWLRRNHLVSVLPPAGCSSRHCVRQRAGFVYILPVQLFAVAEHYYAASIGNASLEPSTHSEQESATAST